jgi:hypothetical protein
MTKRIVEIKKVEKKEETPKKEGVSYGRNYYDKNGTLLKCMEDGCKNPRPRGTQVCRECAKKMAAERGKSSR